MLACFSLISCVKFDRLFVFTLFCGAYFDNEFPLVKYDVLQYCSTYIPLMITITAEIGLVAKSRWFDLIEWFSIWKPVGTIIILPNHPDNDKHTKMPVVITILFLQIHFYRFEVPIKISNQFLRRKFFCLRNARLFLRHVVRL